MLSNFSKILGRFVYYYLSNNFYKVAVEGNAKSTVALLILPQFLNFECSLPCLDNQRSIIDFLDYENSKIGTLIEKQQKLIELLKEKRQAVISHSVTKGLNPKAPMKDSGFEWLGEVQEHWAIKRFKNIFSIQKRIAGVLGLDVLSIIQKGIKVKDIESGSGQLSMDYSKYQLVYKGDFTMNQMDLITGYVDISNFDGVTSPDYRVFKHKDENYSPSNFLFFLQMCYINKLFSLLVKELLILDVGDYQQLLLMSFCLNIRLHLNN